MSFIAHIRYKDKKMNDDLNKLVEFIINLVNKQKDTPTNPENTDK